MAGTSPDEKFINLLMERPYLYDKADADFKLNTKKAQGWEEIGSAFKISGKL